MTKAIFKGIGIDLIGTAIVIVIGFLVVPVYLSFLSAGEYGLWLSINAIVALIGFLDIGTDQYLVATAANTDSFKKNEILDSIFLVFIIKIIVLIFISVSAYVVFLFLDSLIKFNINLNLTASILFLLAFLNLLIATIGSSIPAILIARQHFSLVNSTITLFNIFSSVGAVLLLNFGFGIYAIPASLLLFSTIQYIYLFLWLKNQYPELNIHLQPFKISLLKDLLKYAISFHLVKCVYGVFRVQFILVAMGSILGPTFATSFSVTNRLPSTLCSNSMKLATPFFPSLAELFAQGNLNEIKKIFYGMSKVLVRISFFFVIILGFFNSSFVSLWVGGDLYGGNAVMGLILVYTFLYIPMGAFGIVVYASKRFGWWPLWLLGEILVTILLTLELGPIYGAPGVVFSFVIGAVISQIYLFLLVKKELGFSCRDYLNTIFSYFFLPNLVTLAGAIFLSAIYSVDNWIGLILVTGILTLLQLFSREGIRFISSKEVGLKARITQAFSL